MELMKAALFIALLAATSARPMGWRKHQDADIPDKGWTPGWPDHNGGRWPSRSSESFSREDSSESSESRSSEESSEEILIGDATTPTATTEGSALSPSPDGTPVMETATPEEGGRSTPGTPPPCDQCFTVEIPTEAPTTNNRGDN